MTDHSPAGAARSGSVPPETNVDPSATTLRFQSVLAAVVLVGFPIVVLVMLGPPSLDVPSGWPDARSRIDAGSLPAGYIVNIFCGFLGLTWLTAVWILASGFVKARGWTMGGRRSGRAAGGDDRAEQQSPGDAGVAGASIPRTATRGTGARRRPTAARVPESPRASGRGRRRRRARADEEPWYRQAAPAFDEPVTDAGMMPPAAPIEHPPDRPADAGSGSEDDEPEGDEPEGAAREEPEADEPEPGEITEQAEPETAIVHDSGVPPSVEPPMIIPVRAYYLSRTDDTLRSISAQFLNTPTRWKELRSLNAAYPGIADAGPDTLLPVGTALALPGDPLPWGKPDPVYLWTLAEKFLYTAWGREPAPEEVVPFWRGLAGGAQGLPASPPEAASMSGIPEFVTRLDAEQHEAPAPEPPAEVVEPPEPEPAAVVVEEPEPEPEPPVHVAEPPPPEPAAVVAEPPEPAAVVVEPPEPEPEPEPPVQVAEPEPAVAVVEEPEPEPAVEVAEPPPPEPEPVVHEAEPPPEPEPAVVVAEPPPPEPAVPVAGSPPPAPPVAPAVPPPVSSGPPPPEPLAAQAPPVEPAAPAPVSPPPPPAQPPPPEEPPVDAPPAVPGVHQAPPVTGDAPPADPGVHEPLTAPVEPPYEPPPASAYEPPPAHLPPGLADPDRVEPVEPPAREDEALQVPRFMPSVTTGAATVQLPDEQLVASSQRSLAGTAIGDAMMLWQLARLRRRRSAAARSPAPDLLERSLQESAHEDSLRLIEAAMRQLRAVTVAQLREKPRVVAVRVGAYGFEVLLDQPVEAPEGWQAASEGYVLELPGGVAVEQLDAAGQGPSLCPALVPVGNTVEGPLLLNLEEIGCLAISGPTGPSASLLTSIVETLGSSPLADDIRIIAVGIDAPTGLGWERVHSANFDSPQIEYLLSTATSPAHTGSGAPFDILVMGPGSDLLLQRAGQIAITPGSRLAVVGATSSAAGRWPWRIDMDENFKAVVHPLACTMVAAQAMSPELAHLLSDAPGGPPVPPRY